jgi:NADH-quinone oxidoreductase subunit J
VAVPAILPDGSIAPESISAIIDAAPVVPTQEHPADAHSLTGGRRSVGAAPDRGTDAAPEDPR